MPDDADAGDDQAAQREERIASGDFPARGQPRAAGQFVQHHGASGVAGVVHEGLVCLGIERRADA